MSEASSEAFPRRDGNLYAERVAVTRIVEEVGSPTFIYSAGALVAAYDRLDRAFSGTPHSICFSIKSNMNLAVVATLVARGSGVDVTSGGELFRALRAGADPRKIVYAGVGKRDDEIDAALAAGIKLFNVESRSELRRIDAVAARRGARAPIAFRVNPDVDPKTHPYIATGLRTSKFGIPIGEAVEAYAEAKALEHVEVVGVDCHIGSQLMEVQPFADAAERLRTLVLELRSAGHHIRVIDVGGGLGVAYAEEVPPTAEAYAEAVLGGVGDLDCEIVIEPGRSITANAGILVARVLYRKSNQEKDFVIIDGAMNDLIRPALYQAYHRVEPVGPPRPGMHKSDIVGPVCEPGDFLARDRTLSTLQEGDLLAFRSAGAYSFVMSSNYNARPRAAEVLVSGDRFAVVRQRESLEDLVRGESLPEELLR
jgi:diaminopimelate decarboxylase